MYYLYQDSSLDVVRIETDQTDANQVLEELGVGHSILFVDHENVPFDRYMKVDLATSTVYQDVEAESARLLIEAQDELLHGNDLSE